MFNKILLAYDGSQAANKALEKAVQLVKLTEGAELRVVHVFDFPRVFIGEGLAPIPASINKEYYDLANQTAEDVKNKIAQAGVATVVDVIQGSPAEVILDYAAEHGADVIIVGSRGLGGIREFVLGSVSHNVVQHAKIPVLVVK